MNFKIARYKNLKTDAEAEKTIDFLRNGEFDRANVKKLTPTEYLRAKINYRDRLIFAIGKHQGESVLLILEVIKEHDYDSSKFLYGRKAQEDDFILDETVPMEIPDNALSDSKPFRYTDRFMTFSDEQEGAFATSLPAIIIGSAGSGKTSVIVERLKAEKGRVAYVTKSPFLSQKVADSCIGYEHIDFKCLEELISSFVEEGSREVNFDDFEHFCALYGVKKDIDRFYEEIRGVIAGSYTSSYLSKDDYMKLGVRKTLFHGQKREEAYHVFTKYLKFLKDNNLYDSSIAAYNAMSDSRSNRYDFVIIDEVQDMTSMQVLFIVEKYGKRGRFILSGDANQVVYANYFSWATIKEMLHHHSLGDNITVLDVNYRCAENITAVSNKLLLLKGYRFGSIDRESDTPMLSAFKGGNVALLHKNKAVTHKFKELVQGSINYAIVVFDENAKRLAEKEFSTPLIFTVSEIKGLEYDNIIVLDMVSSYRSQFSQIASGIVLGESRSFARNKNKENREADTLKVYINSLYVAFTRAIHSLYIIESHSHPIWDSIGVKMEGIEERIAALSNEESTVSAWEDEAKRLRKAGKTNQAAKIEGKLSKTEDSTRFTKSTEYTSAMVDAALDPLVFNKKAKDELFGVASLKNDVAMIGKLAALKYSPAMKLLKHSASLSKNTNTILPIRPNMSHVGQDIKKVIKLNLNSAVSDSIHETLTEKLAANNHHIEVAFSYGKDAGIEWISKSLAEYKLLRGWSEKFGGQITPVIDELTGYAYLEAIEPSRRALFSEEEVLLMAKEAEINFSKSTAPDELAVGYYLSLAAQYRDTEARSLIQKFDTNQYIELMSAFYDYKMNLNYLFHKKEARDDLYREVFDFMDKTGAALPNVALLTMLYDGDNYSMLDDSSIAIGAMVNSSIVDTSAWCERVAALFIGLRGVCGIVDSTDFVVAKKVFTASATVMHHLCRTNNISPDFYNPSRENNPMSAEYFLYAKTPYYSKSDDDFDVLNEEFPTISKSIYFRNFNIHIDGEVTLSVQNLIRDTTNHLKKLWVDKGSFSALMEYGLLCAHLEQTSVYAVFKRDYPKSLKLLRDHSNIGFILSSEDLFSSYDSIKHQLDLREMAFCGQFIFENALRSLKNNKSHADIERFTFACNIVLGAYTSGAYWLEDVVEKVKRVADNKIMTDAKEECIKHKYDEVKTIDQILINSISDTIHSAYIESVNKLVKRLSEDEEFKGRYSKHLKAASKILFAFILEKGIEKSVLNFFNEHKNKINKPEKIEL